MSVRPHFTGMCEGPNPIAMRERPRAAHRAVGAHAMSPVITAAGVMLNGILDGRTDLADTAAMCFNKTPCSLDLAAAKSNSQQDSA